MHFDIGVASMFGEDLLHFSLPLGLRYTFLTGSGLAPYLGVGTGYYVDTTDETDHGFQLLHASGGVEYYVDENVAIGIGAEFHGLSLSMKNSGLTNERSWSAVGIRSTLVF